MVSSIRSFLAITIWLWATLACAQVTSWSTNANSNNSAPPLGAPEGAAPSTVNDTMREMMASTAIEAQINRVKYLNSVAGTNTITATMAPALASYSAGMMVIFTPAATNTGATTLNINALGALDVQKFDGDALIAGDLISGVPAMAMLDAGADDWLIVNPQGGVLSSGVSMSDLARLSQANTFTGSGIVQSNLNPFFEWNETDGALNNKRWLMDAASEQFRCRIVNDDGSGSTNWCTVDRTGTTIDSIALTSTALTWNGNSLFTTANDGAGSLFDADLLDGISSAAFAQLSQSQTLTGTNTFTPAGGATFFNGGSAGNYVASMLGDAGAAARLILIAGHTGVSNGLTVVSDGTTLTANMAGNLTVNGQSVRDAAIITSGTLPVARGGTGTTTSTGTGSVVLSASPTLTGTVTGGTFAGTHTGDGSGLTSLDAADITSVPSSGVISSGTYTPTSSDLTGLDSVTPGPAKWSRVGSIVTVSGVATVDPSATGTVQFNLSLPVASAFTTSDNLSGVGQWAADQGTGSRVVRVIGDAGADLANLRMNAGLTASETMTFTFQYQVL